MVFIWTPRFGGGGPDLKRCRASVHERGMGVFNHQCNKAATVFREVDGKPNIGFCKQHDPVAVEARRKKRMERWDRESAGRQAAADERRQQDLAFPDFLAALRAIAKGAKDPAAVARHMLKRHNVKP